MLVENGLVKCGTNFLIVKVECHLALVLKLDFEGCYDQLLLLLESRQGEDRLKWSGEYLLDVGDGKERREFNHMSRFEAFSRFDILLRFAIFWRYSVGRRFEHDETILD